MYTEQKSYIATLHKLDSGNQESRVHVMATTFLDAAALAEGIAADRRSEVIKLEVLE